MAYREMNELVQSSSRTYGAAHQGKLRGRLMTNGANYSTRCVNVVYMNRIETHASDKTSRHTGDADDNKGQLEAAHADQIRSAQSRQVLEYSCSNEYSQSYWRTASPNSESGIRNRLEVRIYNVPVSYPLF